MGFFFHVCSKRRCQGLKIPLVLVFLSVLLSLASLGTLPGICFAVVLALFRRSAGVLVRLGGRHRGRECSRGVWSAWASVTRPGSRGCDFHHCVSVDASSPPPAPPRFFLDSLILFSGSLALLAAFPPREAERLAGVWSRIEAPDPSGIKFWGCVVPWGVHLCQGEGLGIFRDDYSSLLPALARDPSQGLTVKTWCGSG